ncbi:MAG: hypothetical protein ACYDDU_21765 [Dermatophilaceae bacterium]
MGRLTEALAAVDGLAGLPSWRFPQEGTCLNNLNSGLAQTEVTLQNVVDTPATHAASLAGGLAANVDTIATYLMQCPVAAVTSGHLKGVSTLAAEYRQLVEEAIGKVRSDLTDAQAAVTSTEQARRESETSATAALDDLKTAIAQSKAEVTAQASRLDTAITEQGTAFNTLGVSWQKQVDEALASSEGKAEDSTAASEKAGIEQRARSLGAAEEHLNSLAALEKQARDMVNVTARNTISTEYAQYARSQGWFATIWSVLAVAGAITGFIYVTSLLRNFDGVSAAEAIFKSTASAAILGAAGFMGREAAGHRREARDAKRTQLDLNAMEPFLANLSPEHAETLRRNIAERIFRRPLANLRRNTRFDRPLGNSSTDEPDEEGS